MVCARFSGFIKEEEMAQWVAESKQFMVWVDMRDLKPLLEAAQQAMGLIRQENV